MAYTALQLINRSFYLSQVVSRQLQTVDGEQITDGLYLLNSIIDYMNTDIRLIPYFQRYEFDSIPGTEEYFIPDLLYVDTLTFNIGVVRYSMYEMTRKQYFEIPRVDDVESLPFSYRVERELGGSRIFMYFVPAAVYQMKLSGKFSLQPVILQTDMSLTYDTFYIEFLRYALAKKICEEWGVTFPDESKMAFEAMRKKLMDVSPPDLSIQKQTYFNKGPFMDWQYINIPGYWPF